MKATAEIRSLARTHTAAAVRTLVGIMNQRKAPAAARVSAAQALLDRGWGKPRQEIQHSGNVGTYDLSKISDEELANLEAILKSASATELAAD